MKGGKVMWVEKTKDNKYKFREQYKDPLTGNHKKVSVTFDKNTAHTRKEAQMVLERKIGDKLNSIVDGTIKSNVKLGDLSAEWLKDYALKVKPYTLYNATSRSRRIVKDIGKDVLVSKLTSKYLTNYLNDLIYKCNLKNGSVKHYKETLNVMFRYAVLHDYVKANPMHDVSVDYRKEEIADKIEEKYLEPEELKNVLEYLYNVNPVYGRFGEFLYLTGMRYGEAAALTWKDINKRTKPWGATVNGTIVRIPGKKAVKQDSPKTQSSVRTVDLPDRAVEILKEQHKLVSDGFIFRTADSSYLPEPTINGWLRLAKERYHINKKVSCHIFRHTHISKLAELGVPIYIVQQRVGHANDQTTKNIYLHVTRTAKEKYTNKLNLL